MGNTSKIGIDRAPRESGANPVNFLLGWIFYCTIVLPAVAENPYVISRASAQGSSIETASATHSAKGEKFSIVENSSMDQLLALISQAESPHQSYDSVHYGAYVKTPKPPSKMTLGEISLWVNATPGQPHAIGRYQVVPKTFNRVVRSLGLSQNILYDSVTQDLIAQYLIKEAGYEKFVSGEFTTDQFMDKLAGVWAGLPMANGRSRYHGYAGNRATISRADYATAIAYIFPIQSASN